MLSASSSACDGDQKSEHNDENKFYTCPRGW